MRSAMGTGMRWRTGNHHSGPPPGPRSPDLHTRKSAAHKRTTEPVLQRGPCGVLWSLALASRNGFGQDATPRVCGGGMDNMWSQPRRCASCAREWGAGEASPRGDRHPIGLGRAGALTGERGQAGLQRSQAIESRPSTADRHDHPAKDVTTAGVPPGPLSELHPQFAVGCGRHGHLRHERRRDRPRRMVH